MYARVSHLWWNWQTRKIQVLVRATAWRFESSQVHQPSLAAKQRAKAAPPRRPPPPGVEIARYSDPHHFPRFSLRWNINSPFD